MPRKYGAWAAVIAAALSGSLALTMSADAMAGARPAHAGRATASPVTWRFGDHGCTGGFCGQYLQISHSETTNGAWAEIRNGPGDSNERWDAMLLPGTSMYAFQNENSGKCLNDRNNHPSGHVDQWSCGSIPDDNRWYEAAGQPKTWALQSVSAFPQAACVLSSDRWVVFGAIGTGACEWH